MARTQIEAVVSGAEKKFQETQDLAKKDASSLYEGFKEECDRRSNADKALRAELQAKFAALENLLARVGNPGQQWGNPSVPGAVAGTQPAVDNLTDDWIRAWEVRQSGAVASPPGLLVGGDPVLVGMSPGTMPANPVTQWPTAPRPAGAQMLPGTMAANPATQWPAAPRPATSSTETGTFRGRLTIINRDWGDNKRLDLIAQPEAFVTWRDRALGLSLIHI